MRTLLLLAATIIVTTLVVGSCAFRYGVACGVRDGVATTPITCEQATQKRIH